MLQWQHETGAKNRFEGDKLMFIHHPLLNSARRGYSFSKGLSRTFVRLFLFPRETKTLYSVSIQGENHDNNPLTACICPL